MRHILVYIVLYFAVFEAMSLRAMETDASVQEAKFPLHQAIMQRRIDRIKSLIAHKAPVNLRDETERTPLQLAFQATLPRAIQIEIASSLIEAEADMEVLDAQKIPLLLYLIKKVNLQGVGLLLGYGASLVCTDVDNRTPLTYAEYKVTKSKNPKAAEILTLVREYVNGRVPMYAAKIVTQQERDALIAASQESARAARKHEREKLEHDLYMKQNELAYLEVTQQCLLLYREISALRKQLNIKVGRSPKKSYN